MRLFPSKRKPSVTAEVDVEVASSSYEDMRRKRDDEFNTKIVPESIEIANNEYLKLLQSVERLAARDSIYAQDGQAKDLARIKKAQAELEELRQSPPTGEEARELHFALALKSSQIRQAFRKNESRVRLRKETDVKATEFKETLRRLAEISEAKIFKGLELYQTFEAALERLHSLTLHLKKNGYDQDAIEKLEAETSFSVEEASRELAKISDDQLVLKEFKESLVLQALNGGESPKDPEAYLLELIERLAQDLVLVAFRQDIKQHPLFKKLEVSNCTYQLPAACLGLFQEEGRADLLNPEGLSPNVIETLCVLYGGSAYTTLEEAKIAALALES